MATELRSYIDGNWHDGARLVDDINPANPSEAVAQVSMGNTSVAVAAVEAASAAFAGWRRTPAPARGEILRKAADLLEQRASTVGRDLTREEGKTLVEGIGETKRAAAILRYYAGLTLEADGQTYPSLSPKTFLFARREPIGVVAAITPWNFPIAIPAWKIAPALAYGNTVVFKPADLVPGTAWALVEIMSRAPLPKGVINLVMGRGSVVGQTLLDSKDVNAISFSGSVETRAKVAQACAKRGAKYQLEMGGKNPLIVLDDAELNSAVTAAVDGAFYQTGQRCTASSRLIVEKKIHDAFVDKVIAAIKTLKVDHALKDGTQVGPVVDESQLAQDLKYLDIGRKENAELAWGGELLNRDTKGHYLSPALFVNTKNDMRINREEIFGPVATVIRVDSYDEALAVANDTPFGLSSGIFTTSLKAASHFRKHSAAGMVMVNLPTAGVDYHVPF